MNRLQGRMIDFNGIFLIKLSSYHIEVHSVIIGIFQLKDYSMFWFEWLPERCTHQFSIANNPHVFVFFSLPLMYVHRTFTVIFFPQTEEEFRNEHKMNDEKEKPREHKHIRK